MKTKDKILATALHLFNTQGLSKISSRNISEELRISYGNLTYHFPKKDDIILHLYRDRQVELDQVFAKLERDIIALTFMVNSLRDMYQVLYKYKFILLDFPLITREYLPIQAQVVEEFKKRREGLRKLAVFLTHNGFLRPETVEGENESKIHNLLMMTNWWIADAEVFYEGEQEKKQDYYLGIFYNVARPSLTELGLQRFEEAFYGEIKKPQVSW
jgi:AcrR family transcriptional regulator